MLEAHPVGGARLRERHGREAECQGPPHRLGARGGARHGGGGGGEGGGRTSCFDADRTARDEPELHARRRPAARVHELQAIGRQPVPVGNGTRIEPERVATRPQVRERELPGGVRRRHQPVLRPDVDAREPGLARSLNPVVVRIHPHFPDRGARLHRPGAAHLHPRDHFGRGGLAARHQPAGGRAGLGDRARRRNQRRHEAQRPTRAGRKRCPGEEDELAADHDTRVSADRAAGRIARADRELRRDPDARDRQRAGVPHGEGVRDRFADPDLERVRRQVEPERGRGRPDQRHLRGRRRQGRRGLRPDPRDVADQHRVPHRGRHGEHEVDRTTAAGREGAERPAQHLPRHGGRRRGADVLQAHGEGVGQDGVLGRSGSGGVAVAQGVLDLLSDLRLGRTRELLAQGERRD